MHFAEDKVDAPFFITGYQDGKLITASATFESPVVLFQDQAYTNYLPPTLDQLNQNHIETLAQRTPQLVLLGTGATQIFPDVALFVPLFQKQIGFEIMSTDAAARTYNLLIAEGRAVLAAFFL